MIFVSKLKYFALYKSNTLYIAILVVKILKDFSWIKQNTLICSQILGQITKFGETASEAH